MYFCIFSFFTLCFICVPSCTHFIINKLPLHYFFAVETEITDKKLITLSHQITRNCRCLVIYFSACVLVILFFFSPLSTVGWKKSQWKLFNCWLIKQTIELTVGWPRLVTFPCAARDPNFQMSWRECCFGVDFSAIFFPSIDQKKLFSEADPGICVRGASPLQSRPSLSLPYPPLPFTLEVGPP